ncbi:MAG: histidine kinase [Oscillospiraceae bacterium]|nr:histidine kinase [Oscillospiraceae bacterium]
MRTLRRHLPAFALAVLAALSILLVIAVHLRPGHQKYAYAPYSFWILQPVEVTEEEIPEYAGIKRTYTFTLPEGSAANIGARVCFYLRHTTADLFIEDSELIYDSSESGDAHIGHTPGNYWVTVPVRSNYAGARLHITLTPVFRSVCDETPVFYLIGHDQLLNMILLPQDATLLIISLITLMAGVFLCVLAFVLPLSHDDRSHIVFLGGLAICAACWKLADLPSLALALDNYGWHKEIWYLGALMYMMMLVLSLRFLISIRECTRGRFDKLCLSAGLAAAIFLVVCQLLNILELHEVLIWYGVGFAVLHCLAISDKKPSRKELMWLCPFFLTMGVDMFYYNYAGSISHAPFFMIWTVLNLLVRGFGFIRSALIREQLLRRREEELREARIRNMINQIRPHFIYNTLSSIYLLCKDDPPLAMEVIGEFTTYLQANFTAIAASEPIEFNEELRHTKAYLAVQTIMYGDKLSIEYDVPYTAFLLPPLTLQPIVENSILYGVASSGKPEKITIRTVREGSYIRLTVEDDGTGYSPQPADSGDKKHIGLQNVRERLDLLCSGTLDIAALQGGGTVVTIIIPDKSDPGNVADGGPDPLPLNS